jgi:hypothetical protein
MGINNATSQFPCPFCKIHFCTSKSVQSSNQNETNRENFKNQMNLEWDLGSIFELNNQHETGSDDERESDGETESEDEIEDPRERGDINSSYRTLTEAKLVHNNNNILIRKGKIFIKIILF